MPERNENRWPRSGRSWSKRQNCYRMPAARTGPFRQSTGDRLFFPFSPKPIACLRHRPIPAWPSRPYSFRPCPCHSYSLRWKKDPGGEFAANGSPNSSRQKCMRYRMPRPTRRRKAAEARPSPRTCALASCRFQSYAKRLSGCNLMCLEIERCRRGSEHPPRNVTCSGCFPRRRIPEFASPGGA